MKFATALFLLASSAAAFVPQQSHHSDRASTALSATSVNGEFQPNPAIKVMAQGMGLLKPVFGAEAQLQAALLGSSVDDEQVADDIQETIRQNKIVIYTYSLSPFSTEAVRLLKESSFAFEEIELGAEWFLLGRETSVARVELAKLAENGATSLPKIFIGGECIGGCSELASLVESGEFQELMKQKRVPKAGASKSRKMW